MKTFRKILFWLHLTAGVVAGLIVFVMSVTGLLLTYEIQMTSRADKNAYKVRAGAPNAEPLAPEALLAKVGEAGAPPASLTLRADCRGRRVILTGTTS